MPKPSDFANALRQPSPRLAQLVGPAPLKPPEVMKAVLAHVTKHKLWKTPSQTFVPDTLLREALKCSLAEMHVMRLPGFLDAQLGPVPGQRDTLRAKQKKEANAHPLSARWREGDGFDNPCVTFDEAALEGVELNARTRTFLLSVGLPESAAPFIDFDAEREGEPLRELSDQTGREQDHGLRILGLCGDGEEEDPRVCLDERQGGRIVLRTPEDDSAPVLMNSGVHELLECLMVYRDILAERTEAEVDFEDEEDDGPLLLPRRLRARAAKELEARDPKAFKPGSFWYTQAHGPEGTRDATKAPSKPKATRKPTTVQKKSSQKKSASKAPRQKTPQKKSAPRKSASEKTPRAR